MPDLSRLLNPRSVALFGGAWAENVIVQLQKSRYSGEIWPVHPSREMMCGIACFASIADLPSAPDASFVGVNRELTIDVVEALSEMGAGGAVCFASGFLESDTEQTGGADLQAKLVEAAGKMPILGPNCYGILNYLDNIKLWPDQHGGRPCKAGVALIGQSSNILINMTMQKRALPIAYTIAVGNQASVSLSDVARATLADDRVTALGLYVEGFGDLRAFEEMAAHARELGKPIVAIKAGKSENSRSATLSHTASLAGSAAASSALLQRLGIVEVESIAVFLETLKILHVVGPLEGKSIASLSCSGGEAGLMADMAEETTIHFRKLSAKAADKLKSNLGPMVTVANPLDYHTFIWADREKLEATYSAVFEDGYDLSVLVMDVPPSPRCDDTAWQVPLEAAITARQKTKGKVALLTTLPENLSEEISDRLLAHGIVPLHGMEEMIAAIPAAIRAGDSACQATKPVLIGQPEDRSKTVRQFALLDENQAKKELAKFGLHFPRAVTAETPAKIAKASHSLTFPVALKGLGIAHKSEAGAVALNLDTPQIVERSATAMSGTIGYLAEEMVSGAVAELIIGITRDETGLFVLTIGAGGVLTELLQDSASLIIPAEQEEIAQALSDLRVSRILDGYRGKPAADKNAIVSAIMAVQNYCINTPHLLELDINPLMALPDAAIAVDALIKLEA
ncbi:MAG: acetate--CoA ligase family protein [Pseudomonadota bacterium]